MLEQDQIPGKIKYEVDYLPLLGTKQPLSTWCTHSLHQKHTNAFLHFFEFHCSKTG